MAKWSKVLVSGTSRFDPVMVTLLQFNTFSCEKTIRKKINNMPSTLIDYICRMAEWSKVLVSGTSRFDGVGSDTTLLMLHCYKLTVLAAEKQFENNNQHTFNCI